MSEPIVSCYMIWVLWPKLISCLPSSSLTSALIRPGRFDMQVTVPRPDVKGRTEILKWYLRKIKVDSGRPLSFCLDNRDL